MRNFTKKTLIFALGLIAVFSTLFFGRIFFSHLVDWRLPNDKHVVFMGASHLQEGINPDFYDGAINIASVSERYMFTYLKLEKLLKVNKQIDTVFLQFAPTDMHKNADTKYFNKNEMLHFLPLYYPFFSKKEWSYYLKESLKSKNSVALNVLLSKQLNRLPKSVESYGSFRSYKHEFDREKPPYKMPKWLNKGSSINYHYLKEIVKTCKKNDIEIILIYMPMYNKAHFYNTDYFYKQYKMHFNDVDFIDYSDWHCEDSLRKDEHHLNQKGAKVFTEQLNHHFSIKNKTEYSQYRKMD